MNSRVGDVAMYSRNAGGTSQFQRFKKSYNGVKGHTKDNCWKIIRYPPDFKNRKTPKMEGGAVSNVVIDQDNISGQGSYVQPGNHGVAGPSSQRTGVQGARQCSQSHVSGGYSNTGLQMSQINQMGTADFTKEQYEQIVQLISQNRKAANDFESANATGISNVFLVSFEVHDG